MGARITKRKAARDFGIASAFSVLCLFLLGSTHEIEARKPHVWISGALEEWETIGRRRPALRLRLKNQTLDFRVDIDMFREGMNREIPSGFAPGAQVGVLVQEEQYLHPITPPLARGARIAWVRGLQVAGKEIFVLATARSWEERNRRWGYVVFLASAGFVLYTGLRWRRASLR